MAKKKFIDTEDGVNVVCDDNANSLVVDSMLFVDNEEGCLSTVEDTVTLAKDKSATESTHPEVIPAKAMDFLKRHTDVQAVYIDKIGGVFSTDTPKVFVKGAVLYQNPYYKH